MRALLGYLPQQVPYYPNLTARQYLNYIAAIKGIPAKAGKQQISTLLAQFHLSQTGKTKLKDFSGGMRQRVGLVATLLGDSKIIIVDEPTTGLDPMERATMRNILSELAATRIVILSTHIVSDIEAAATKLLILKTGKFVYQGTSTGLIDRVKNYVWEDVLPFGQVPQHDRNVSSIVQAIDGTHIRVIAKESPSTNAQLVAPRLEDASLAMMEGIIQ